MCVDNEFNDSIVYTYNVAEEHYIIAYMFI